MKTDVTLNLSEGSIDYEQETEDDDPNYNETEEFRKYMDGEVFYGVHCRNSNRGRCFSYGRKCRRGQIKRENKNVFKAILGYDPRSSRGFFYNQQKVPPVSRGTFCGNKRERNQFVLLHYLYEIRPGSICKDK